LLAPGEVGDGFALWGEGGVVGHLYRERYISTRYIRQEMKKQGDIH
jgi:hypothetical protein